MQSPDIRVYLHDLKQSCELIRSFIEECDLETYISDPMRKSAVERQFILIGEALNQMLIHFPEEKEYFPNASRIISFRNRLTHAYRTISDDIIWGIIQKSLPSFCLMVNQLYDRRGDNR